MNTDPELDRTLDGLPIVGHNHRRALALGNERLVAARRTGSSTVQAIFDTFAGSVSERGIRIVTLTANVADNATGTTILSWSVAQEHVTRTPGVVESRKGTVSQALPVLEAFWARAGAR